MIPAVMVTACFLAAVFAAVRLPAVRRRLSQGLSALDRYQFSCRVELVTSDLQADEDTFFSVSMMGRIPVPRSNVDTQVRIEIVDITDGPSKPQSVLSVSDEYRSPGAASFGYAADNGIVPNPDSVLPEWVPVADIPIGILRFAYRGRRRLQFRITVICKDTQQEVVSALHAIEYVSCSDGYIELQKRRIDVIQASIGFVLAIHDNPPPAGDIEIFWVQWIRDHLQFEAADEQVRRIIATAQAKQTEKSLRDYSEVILAYGHHRDRPAAAALALETAVVLGHMSKTSFARLAAVVGTLNIPSDRFLAMAQKILLNTGCLLEDPSQLLGIVEEMPREAFLKRLNAEYKKWNARVTHPDPQIRLQADRMLTLIADLRSRGLIPCA